VPQCHRASHGVRSPCTFRRAMRRRLQARRRRRRPPRRVARRALPHRRRVPGARRVQRRAEQPGDVPGRADGHVDGGGRRRRERVGRDGAGADARRRACRRLAPRAVPGHRGRRRAPPAG
jgi:hypothetical protein